MTGYSINGVPRCNCVRACLTDCTDTYRAEGVCVCVYRPGKRAFLSGAFPANRGLTGLGRTSVITSTVSHKQMAKQMILAHLTHDHPYLFHGCWPTDSPCLSLLHECLGRGRVADTHKCLENKIGMKKEANEREETSESDRKKKLWGEKKIKENKCMWRLLLITAVK